MVEEQVTFSPPPIKAGTFVKWFRDADPSSEGYIGLVSKAGERAINLRVLNDDCPWLLNSVHHIDDPELKARKGLRKYGAWDYLPQDKETAEKIQALEKMIEGKERIANERIGALVKRLEKLESELGMDSKKGK